MEKAKQTNKTNKKTVTITNQLKIQTQGNMHMGKPTTEQYTGEEHNQ